MSTKTTFKRIALVAVDSLGFGVLSTAPSFAADAVAALSTSVTEMVNALKKQITSLTNLVIKIQ